MAGGVQELGLLGACSGLVAVAPAGRDGQGHEDGLDAAAGLEAKGGAAVVDQVELHVAAAAQLRGPGGGGRV